MKRYIAILLSALMLLSAISGCKNTSSESTGSQSENAASGTSNVKNENIIRYTLTALPKIDPAAGADFGASTVLVNIYDTLLMPTADGGMEPWIATDWSTSEDGLKWTFHIRDDVKFHSGNILTAEDVAYSMNRMIALGTGFGYLYTSTIESAEAIDDSTVEFNCKTINGTLLSALARLYILDSETVMANYTEGNYGEHGDYGQAYLLETDAGSGPYMVEEYEANSYIQCVQFDDYWAGFKENNPERFKAIGTNEAVTVKTMIQRKELEFTDIYQSSETLSELDAIEGVDLINVSYGGILYLLLNNAKAPTDDPHIRKALGYMMDYDTINNVISPGSIQANSIVSSSVLGHKKMHDFSYNIEKAKEEIALSKYANNIKDYPIEVCWVAETADREKLALLIQAVASEVGINIQVVKTPWTSVVANSASIDTTPNATTTVASPDYCEAGALFESALLSREDGTGTWMNCSWVNDPELDKMIRAALSTIDKEERVKQYEAIQDYLADDCVMLPLCEIAQRMAYQADYINFPPEEEKIPVMGYTFYMRSIEILPDQR